MANNCGRGLKQLAFRHLPLFKHPFCRYCPDKHRCLKTGAYGNTPHAPQADSTYCCTTVILNDQSKYSCSNHPLLTLLSLHSDMAAAIRWPTCTQSYSFIYTSLHVGVEMILRDKTSPMLVKFCAWRRKQSRFINCDKQQNQSGFVCIYICITFGTVLQAFGQHHCPRGVVGALSSFISTSSGTLSGTLRFQLCKLHCLISMQEMQKITPVSTLVQVTNQ